MSVDSAPTEAFLDPADVAPLLRAMHDASPDVRQATFEALIRLPLAPSDWAEVGAYATWVVDSGDSPGERWGVIDATPFVPVRSFRERVARLLDGGEEADRLSAALALALAGDPRSAAPLIEALGDPGRPDRDRAEPARRLALVDVSAVRDTLAKKCRKFRGDDPSKVMVRFWLALALARAGADAELRRLFEDLGRRVVDVDELHVVAGDWGSGSPYPALTPGEVAGPPLPGGTVRWLTALTGSSHEFAPLAGLIVQASAPAAAHEEEGTKLAPAWAAGGAAGFVHLSASEIGRARKRLAALGLLDVDSRNFREDALATVEREALEPAAVIVLFERAAKDENVGVVLGNALVQWVASLQRPFQPDALGLGREYARQARENAVRALRWQIGWAVSRGGLRGIVSELAAALASPDPHDRIEAGHLIADAADYVTDTYPPLFGGGEAPHGPSAVTEFVAEAAEGPVAAMTRALPPQPQAPREAFDEPIDFSVGGGLDAVPADEPSPATAARVGEEPMPTAEPAAGAPHEAFGQIVAPDIAVVGEAFELEVGIAPERSAGVAGGAMELPSLEGPAYVLDVQIVADTFDIGADESFRQRLDVSKKTPFPLAKVHLTARPQRTVKTTRSINLTFGLDGETVGMATRYVDVYAVGRAPAIPRAVATVRGVTSAVPTGESKADVTIEITVPDLSGTLRWRVRSPHDGVEPAGDSAIKTQLQKSPAAFAEGIRTVVEQNDASAIEGSILLGEGRNIGRAIPDAVWKALRRARQKVDDRPLDVLILSQDPYIPWELAVPETPLSPDGRSTFLGAETNIGRWLLGNPPPSPSPPRAVNARSIGVIRGRYGGPRYERLPGADAEVRTLSTRYQATLVAARDRPIRRLLQGDPTFDILHFATHGAVDESGAGDGLVLAERASDGALVKLGPLQVDAWRLPKGSPFVFLNACQVGAGTAGLASYGGMAAAFLRWGAAGVVAPIWAIDDKISHNIALGIYERALVDADAPAIASLLREARQRFNPDADKTSATFLAYQLYGHPSMRLVRGAPDHA
jgi:CHAT domain-containing protein